MKAYEVTTIFGDLGSDIVWAEKPSGAKKMAARMERFHDVQFTDLRVRRIPDLDGMIDECPREGAWYSDEIRTILVRDHDWACIEPVGEECDTCCARQWCHYME